MGIWCEHRNKLSLKVNMKVSILPVNNHCHLFRELEYKRHFLPIENRSWSPRQSRAVRQVRKFVERYWLWRQVFQVYHQHVVVQAFVCQTPCIDHFRRARNNGKGFTGALLYVNNPCLLYVSQIALLYSILLESLPYD